MIKKVISFLYSVIFCTVVAIGMPQIAEAAAEEVAIDEINFPDEIFRNYVKKFDINDNNNLSDEEIANVEEMDICDRNIASLKGIEYFTSLTSLSCSKNNLTELDVSKNILLTSLDCDFNQLNVLDVSKNVDLIELLCSVNKLTNLNVSCNINLMTLGCACNQINELDLNCNTNLTELGCYNNQLTELDLSHSPALTALDCPGNPLVKLNLSRNPDLIDLYCNSDQLTELDLSHNPDLTRLTCYCDQLTELDLSHNPNLTYLACSANQLTKLKLHSQTYNKLPLYKKRLYYSNNVNLSDFQNITETATNDANTVSLLKVIDITKPATYKVNGKDFTIIYADTVVMASATPSVNPGVSPSAEPSAMPSPGPSTAPSPEPSSSPSDIHIFSDYNYDNPITNLAPVIYGNGIIKTINGKKINNKTLTVYTDIAASYKYTLNSRGIVKPAVGKVIVAVTKTDSKPAVNDKNKITDTSASNIAKAKIKNGQITITATGKEGGLVYLWVIDTGSKGVSACCPIDVKLAPKKLEIQGTSGNKLINPKLQNKTTLDVHIIGISGSIKTEDCTYTPTVDSRYQQYIQIDSKGVTGQDFTITAKGLKNNKDTQVTITFTCDQNGKKTNFSLIVTK